MSGRSSHRWVGAVAVVTVAVVAALVVGAGRAAACSCVPSPGPEEALAAAHMVFVGTVVELGELVYAARRDGAMITSFCHRTAPVHQAAADLEALGNVVAPVPMAPPDTGAPWLFPLAAVALLAMPLATWAALRFGERGRP